MPGASSTLSLTTLRRPAWSRAASCTTGSTHLHGPHQGAQKSTSTGTDALISASKLAASAGTSHGRCRRQFAHRGTPSYLGATRFLVSQWGHLTTAAAISPPQGAVQAAHRD